MPRHRSDARGPRDQIAEIFAVTLLEMLIREGVSNGDAPARDVPRESTARATSRCSPSVQ